LQQSTKEWKLSLLRVGFCRHEISAHCGGAEEVQAIIYLLRNNYSWQLQDGNYRSKLKLKKQVHCAMLRSLHYHTRSQSFRR